MWQAALDKYPEAVRRRAQDLAHQQAGKHVVTLVEDDAWMFGTGASDNGGEVSMVWKVQENGEMPKQDLLRVLRWKLARGTNRPQLPK